MHKIVTQETGATFNASAKIWKAWVEGKDASINMANDLITDIILYNEEIFIRLGEMTQSSAEESEYIRTMLQQISRKCKDVETSNHSLFMNPKT
jgi:hypothetical protein